MFMIGSPYFSFVAVFVKQTLSFLSQVLYSSLFSCVYHFRPALDCIQNKICNSSSNTHFRNKELTPSSG